MELPEEGGRPTTYDRKLWFESELKAISDGYSNHERPPLESPGAPESPTDFVLRHVEGCTGPTCGRSKPSWGSPKRLRVHSSTIESVDTRGGERTES